MNYVNEPVNNTNTIVGQQNIASWFFSEMFICELQVTFTACLYSHKGNEMTEVKTDFITMENHLA